MFEASILSGCWDEETIELRGMPKDFILSARKLIVLETDEYDALQAENKRLKEAIEGNALLSGDGLSALKSMASVEFMVKACAGSLSPIDVAESINGIIQDAKAKAEQTLKDK